MRSRPAKLAQRHKVGLVGPPLRKEPELRVARRHRRVQRRDGEDAFDGRNVPLGLNPAAAEHVAADDAARTEVHRDDRLARRVLEGGAVAAPLVLGAEPRAHLGHHQRELWAASHAEDGARRRRRADRRAERVLPRRQPRLEGCNRRALGVDGAQRARRDAARDLEERVLQLPRSSQSAIAVVEPCVDDSVCGPTSRSEHVEDRRAQEERRAEAVAARRDGGHQAAEFARRQRAARRTACSASIFSRAVRAAASPASGALGAIALVGVAGEPCVQPHGPHLVLEQVEAKSAQDHDAVRAEQYVRAGCACKRSRCSLRHQWIAVAHRGAASGRTKKNVEA